MVTGYGGGVRLLYVQVVLMNARVGDLEIGGMCGQWVPSGEIRGVNGSIELKYPGPVYSRSEQILTDTPGMQHRDRESPIHHVTTSSTDRPSKIKLVYY
jgi:hypothetical protein